ncbi:uncharacterized protein LOC135492497 [Lineus longissimus]|uniref:uncharacterized protein LOC135492497 n=1 Tax=Lineus longissimus TaxID=88925 RepID=UPI00315CF8AF
MEQAMCSMPQDLTQFNQSQDSDMIRNCKMSMFSRPRNKRKGYYPNGINRMMNEQNRYSPDSYDMDMTDSSENSNLDSPLPLVNSNNEPQRNGFEPQNHSEAQLSPNGDIPKMSPGSQMVAPPSPVGAQVASSMESMKAQYAEAIKSDIQRQHDGNHANHFLGSFSPNSQPMPNLHSPPQHMNSYSYSSQNFTDQLKSFHADHIKREPTSPPSPLTPHGMNGVDKQGLGSTRADGAYEYNEPLDFSQPVKKEPGSTGSNGSNADSLEIKSQYSPKNGSMDEADGMGNFTCRHCHRPFKSQVNLDRHVEKSHNPKSNKIFTCLLCPYTTKFYSNMYVHIRTHTGDKPYWCGACGASFSQGSSLKIHIISKHGGNKKYFILDRKLGKANLLRFWQRRESASLKSPDGSDNLRPDIKPDINGLNMNMNMNSLNMKMNLNMNMNMPRDLQNGGHMPNGLDQIDGGKIPTSQPQHNSFLPNQNPMNSNFGMFPNGLNGMNMFNHMMNPLGMLGQNPLNPNMMGLPGLNNSNMFLQPGLLNSLNLKNSAFFTKTTQYQNGEDRERNGDAKPQGFPGLEGASKDLMGNGNGAMMPSDLNINCNDMPRFPHGMPHMSPSVSSGHSNATPTLSPNMMPRMSTPQRLQPQISPSMPPMNQMNGNGVPLPRPPQPMSPPRHQLNNNNMKSPLTHTLTPSINGHVNIPINGITPDNSPIKDSPTDAKLRELRKNVVKMLRMMVPDLQMDKNLNQEGEDVDVLLKEVIWSTVTEMDTVDGNL